jgi:hypothetical protein
MLTLLSTLLGFASSGLPKLLEFFQDKSDKRHELELMRLQTERELELQKAGFQIQKEVAEINYGSQVVDARIREAEALYAFSSKLNEGASSWIVNLRASVQPVITYGLFALLIAVDAFAAWYAYYSSVSFSETIYMIWSEDTQALWGAIVAFWFGGRQFGNGKR